VTRRTSKPVFWWAANFAGFRSQTTLSHVAVPGITKRTGYLPDKE
jgi:hypothetical protein